MANEFEHLFGCFLAVCVSCLQHRLFKSALKLGCMLPLLRPSHKPHREVPGLPDRASPPSLGASPLTLLRPSRPQSSKPVTVRVLCRGFPLSPLPPHPPLHGSSGISLRKSFPVLLVSRAFPDTHPQAFSIPSQGFFWISFLVSHKIQKNWPPV